MKYQTMHKNLVRSVAKAFKSFSTVVFC